MYDRMNNWFYSVRASYWFIPVLMSIGGVGMGLLLVIFDLRGGDGALLSRLLSTISAQQASTVLAALASGSITVVGTIFSLTLVALVLASQQYGPRIVEGFLRDRGVQVVIGAFVATFAYLVISLVMIHNVNILRAALLIALLLVLTDILLLIYYIHHVAVAIRSETILKLVVQDIKIVSASLYPHRIGHEPPPQFEPPTFALQEEVMFRAEQSGYFQNVYPEIVSYARAHDLVVRVESHPGAFVLRGQPLITVLHGRVDAHTARDLLALIDIGGARTVEQDMKFLFDKLTETATRALSAAINDPVTAIMCLDRIAEGLLLLAEHQDQSVYRMDDAGALRVVITRPVTVSWMITEAFTPIRRHGKNDLNIMMHLISVIGRLAEQIRDPESQRALHYEAHLVMQQTHHSQNFLPEELELLEKRYAWMTLFFDPNIVR